MEMKKFEFEGKTYRPIGNILGGFVVKSSYFNWKKTIEYSCWENFMKVAKKNKASCDIYKCLDDENYYIPLNKCLALVDEKVFNTKYFKSIEEYSKWYK
jgi:hypothetical protein